MTTLLKTLSLPLLLLAATALSGCDSNVPSTRTFDGPPITIGDGTARTFLRINGNDEPEAIGIVLSETALQGLPNNPSNPSHEHENMHVMQLPAEVRARNIPIDHVSLDWNAQGHEPPGLFTYPHFDMHFYMVPAAERLNNWQFSNPEFVQKAMQIPEARYIPEGYVSPPGNEPIPTMGLHWVDGNDPTYAPGGPQFTEVFIWGSYNGQIVFPEPMITKAFLETRPHHEETLAQPQAFARTGYYPTRYSVRYDAAQKHFVIALEGLTYRTAG